jgi:hypothetical protein
MKWVWGQELQATGAAVTEGAAIGAMRGDEVGVGCEGGVMKWAPSDEGSSSGWWGRYLGRSIVGTLDGLFVGAA